MSAAVLAIFPTTENIPTNSIRSGSIDNPSGIRRSSDESIWIKYKKTIADEFFGKKIRRNMNEKIQMIDRIKLEEEDSEETDEEWIENT